MNEKDVKIIEEILKKGNDVEIRRNETTGKIVIFEVKKRRMNGK